MEPRLEQLTFNLSGANKRYETLEGKKYLVVPMVMLTEGVHAGSNGPLLYTKEEMGKTPVVWNHKPLVVYHPERNGKGVSACLPEVLEKRKVGIVMNTTFDGRLASEAWFDEDKLKQVDKRVLDAIHNNKMMEVSTGLFTDNENKPGKWNGEDYVAIARNFRPDHLAILPDKVGACSIKDGAGLCRNEAKDLLDNEGAELSEDDQQELVTYNNRWPQAKRDKLPAADFAGPHKSFPIKTQKDVESAEQLAGHAANPAGVKKRIKSIAKRKGLNVPASLNEEQTTTNVSFSHDTIKKAISTELRGKVKTAHGLVGDDHYVHDVYDDFFISRSYKGGEPKYYMNSYELEPQSGTNTGADSDKPQFPKIKITGTPKEVKQVMSWHDLDGNLVANNFDELMALENQREETKQVLIDELKTLGFDTEAELMMLQRQSVDRLALLVQNVHMEAQIDTVLNADAAGAGPAASSGGVPPGGSINPAAKQFAQRKARTKPARKKKQEVY